MALKLAEVLKAAGERTRLRILNLLLQGSICVCDLQTVLDLPQHTVSRHLAMLRHAGLVRDLREGQRVLYSLAPATASRVRAFYEFLEKVSRDEEILRRDLEALDRATQRGECFVLGRKPTAGEASTAGQGA